MGVGNVSGVRGVRRAMVALVASGALGCQEYNVYNGGGLSGSAEVPSLGTPVKTDTIVQAIPSRVDVMWVVDNSCSMSDRQDRLGDRFTEFLGMFLDSDLDWHIGVISTDTDARTHGGRLQPSRDGTRYLDPTTPEADTKFRQMASLGSTGSPDERGVRATLQALTTSRAENAGFFRPDAALHVIVLSDEDDFSGAGQKFELINVLQQRQADVPVSFSSIVALQPTGCGRFDDGSRGQAYIDVTEAVGGIWTDICPADWTTVLEELGERASGRKREFFLSEVPVPGSLEVTVRAPRGGVRKGIDLDAMPVGPTLAQVCARRHGDSAVCFGYFYDNVRNSVNMVDWLPAANAEVEVTYELLSGFQGRVVEGESGE